MQRINGHIVLSASDLMRYQGCEHAAALDLRYLNGEQLNPAEDTASARLIQSKGDAHERAFLDSLTQSGKSLHSIDKNTLSFNDAVAVTRVALGAGPDYVYQAALSGDGWGGFTDFLERVDKPSDLGAFSYEVIDTKLKRSPDPKHVLQLIVYSDLLADVQGRTPEHIHLVLGDGKRVSLRLADYASYARHLRRRFEEFIMHPPPTRADPVPACNLCRWRERCAEDWKSNDSLCLVAGIRAGQRLKLEAAGVTTMAGLAYLTSKVANLSSDTLTKLRTQARLQDARRAGGAPAFELRPAVPGKGLAQLPKPANGDLFFDMEGDPLIEGGLEYLFGIYCEAGGAQPFRAFWAHDRVEERAATAQVLAFFAQHLRAHPDAHIYHYNHYEVTALKRLGSGHGVGEAVLDQLLRERRFVDLYRIVQQGLVASEPGYSIKDLEVFYADKRTDEVTTAGDSIVVYEQWREDKDPALLERIRAYNETDCRSTKGLRDWLIKSARPPSLPWPEPSVLAAEQSEDQRTAEVEQARAQLRQRLQSITGPMAGEPAELLFELAWFHQREDKPQWWAMFDRAERETEELVEDLDSLGDLTAIGPSHPDKRSRVRAYTYPAQETKLREESKVRMKVDLKSVAITHIDPVARAVEVKFGPKAGLPPDQLDLIPAGPIDNDVLRDAVRRVANDVFAGGGRYRAIEGLLAKDPPRLKDHQTGTPLIDAAADIATATTAAVCRLDCSCLPIQGPPGTGKTYVSSHAILALVRQGRRVAVTSNSHKAIDNLLAAVATRAREQKFVLRAIKKVSGDETPPHPAIEVTNSNDDGRLASYPLVGGTAWLLARPEHDQQFDYLFVDEAGQLSLANIVAMGAAARNIVLVGDPMQLAQPVQGTHPGESACSALTYVLAGTSTVAQDRGIFLPVTRRMHPLICDYISTLVYDGRLRADDGAARQSLLLTHPAPPLIPAGLAFVPVTHAGNTHSSVEEAHAIVEAYRGLIGQWFRDRDGNKQPIGPAEILVVTPYNAQVNLLRQALPSNARVGTVDKFQGQEAPVCLISMATSSSDELPRNIEFLFSVNRLNVAISRAKALALVFASPRLLDVPCRTIEQMRLVNALCAVEGHLGSAHLAGKRATPI